MEAFPLMRHAHIITQTVIMMSPETEHYLVLRDGEARFNNIPVDGSSKMDDAYMDAIEPFDYSAITDFHTDYLPGYAAQTYDEDVIRRNANSNSRKKHNNCSYPQNMRLHNADTTYQQNQHHTKQR